MNCSIDPTEPISYDVFVKATGSVPVDDDLERCNCLRAGELGHMQCGWNKNKNKPVFMVGRD